MKKLLFCCVFLIGCFCFGQNAKIDSLLKQSFRNKSFAVYNNLSLEYININKDSAAYYNSLSEKYVKNGKEKGQFLSMKSIVLLLHNEIIECEKTALQSLIFSKKASDFETQSKTFNVLANIKNQQGYFNKAEEYSKMALQTAIKTQNNVKILIPLINYGSSLIQNEKVEEGIEIYKSAEKYFSNHNKMEQGYIFSNLGRVFLDRNDFKEALIYIKKAEQKFKEINYINYNFQLQTSYSEIYVGLKKKKEALFHLDKATLFAANDNDFSDIAFITAQLNYNFGAYDKAKKELLKAININKKQEQFSKLGEDYILLSEILHEQKNYAEAEKYLTEAILLFKENDEKKNIQVAYQHIFPTFFLKLRREDYNQYFKEYLKLNENIFKIEKQKAINDLDAKYQTTEKQAQIKTQQLQIQTEKNNKYIAFGGIGVLLLLTSGGFWFFKNKQKTTALQTQNTLLSLQQNINSMELQNLNQQLNPHEIKNLLASISPEIQEKAPEAYKKMLKLFNITKASLNSNSITDTIENQVQQIDDFLSLEKSMSVVPIIYSIENNIQNNQQQIPRLLLKNLVENSIKHGIKGTENGGEILISLNEKDNFITLFVDDTGKGRNHAISLDSGIGTTTYQKLFATLNQKNKENATFEIIDKEQGTKVAIRIPIDYKYS